ncbi:beta-ketoacyl synthase [Amycolatopsis sp.]|uniref:beta-ketoacyl synthase n=1 Tax=Amycolatopsis sp. TaxID=37632 RepID=UPI002CF84A32|nr:beta-ketoacyl synthase [Amycolatopsis sp.]HVV12547.1 beta-ketoacyl synthase [Amycolatopsis sp.]
MTIVEFVGEPLDLVAPEPVTHNGNPVREIREALAEAHISALRAQTALQLRTLDRRSVAVAGQAAEEGAFKPPARTGVTELGHALLARLAEGDIAGVFGAAYDQQGANPDIRLAAQVLTSAKLRRQGITASYHGGYAEAAAEAARLFALYLGLHLCFVDATLVTEGRIEGDGELALEFVAADLVPRPWVRLAAGGQEITVTVKEKPGTPIGPERGGDVPWLGRKGALLSEFHMAHLSRGDQGIAMGPEFAHYTGQKATRLPAGGLLLVDRVVDIQGRRGKLDHATYETEYDSPADSWYYRDTANESMPNFVYMETSLQAALLVGYYLGPTLSTPDRTMSLRNLGGTATVLREVDLRDKTIRQRSELLSTTILPGSSLQNFAYTLSADGEPFYRGETMFGYFSDEALANQTGLDAGRSVPTWLAGNPGPTRRLSIPPSGKLTLLDHVDVVDGGGVYGQGYLHSVRRIDPADWFFARHFHLDPVIPGSLGVESVLQAMQAWLLDAGHGLTEPGFVVPAGDPFSWKYRGQFLPADGECVLEVHIKEVRRGPGRVRVIGDASLWKPGLRIYELTDVAVELRERGARPW